MKETDPGSILTNQPFFDSPPFTLDLPVPYEIARDTLERPHRAHEYQFDPKKEVNTERMLVQFESYQLEILHQVFGDVERFCVKVLSTRSDVPTSPLTFWSLWHDFKAKVSQAPSDQSALPAVNHISLPVSLSMQSPPARHLGQLIRQQRKSKGLTQTQLAKASRTTASMISRIESGDLTPQQKTIDKISNALNGKKD